MKGFKKGHKYFPRKAMTFCWTCGVDIEEKNAIKSQGYDFCSQKCKRLFDDEKEWEK